MTLAVGADFTAVSVRRGLSRASSEALDGFRDFLAQRGQDEARSLKPFEVGES